MSLTRQVLVELIENPAPLFPGTLLPSLVSLCMGAALERTLDLGTREQALQVLQWLARCEVEWGGMESV